MADGAGRTGASLFDGRLSVLGQRWRLRPADGEAAALVARQSGLPDMVARALAARGVAPGDVTAHLQPTLRASLPDPDRLTDMVLATETLVSAIHTGRRIAVFADYDVDGATSAAQIVRYLRQIGQPDPLVYVPDRSTEGYGPNIPAIDHLAGQGAEVLVLVDCGTAADGPLQHARSLGLVCIVLDHHAIAAVPTGGHPVVNPNRPDDTSGLGHVAACGVVFLFLVALNRALRAGGHFAARPEPDLRSLLDLVALGTVCDVVPMVGLNRAFVRQGVTVAQARGNPGLAALAEAAGLTRPMDAGAFGFAIGPRLNAGGRLGRSDSAAILLSSDDPQVIAAQVSVLCQHNEERKTVEAAVLAEAQARAADQVEAGARVILVAGDGWHPGVIGLVAGRLRERFHRAACVVAWDGDTGKGSGRSVPGFDLGGAIRAAQTDGVLAAGGGHTMAAGFTVARDRLADLHAALNDAAVAVDLVPELEVDGLLSAGGATVQTQAALDALGPFGPSNPEPRLVLPDVQVMHARTVGAGHIACRLRAGDGSMLDAIAFRAADTALEPHLNALYAPPLALAGSLMRDDWQGRTRVKLRIDDAMAPGSSGDPPP